MLRDRNKSAIYFEQLIPQYLQGIADVESSLDDGSMPLPDEQTDLANDLFDLRLAYVIACYSQGETIAELAPKVAQILEAKKRYIECADSLPERQQAYRYRFEDISQKVEIKDGHNINNYIYVLWWLSLVVATKQSQEHCLEVLSCIGHRGQDALLDRIAFMLGDEEQPQAKQLLYPHLYRPLLKAFDSSNNQRAGHINTFLTDWYSSCWQTAWYGNHNKEDDEEGNWDFYFGYWSLEAILAVNLLKVDDSSLRCHRNYPSHLLIV